MSNHEYQQVHPNDEDEESIELVQEGRRRLNRTLGSAPSAESSQSSSSTIIRWIVIVLLMIGMYILGTMEGKSKALKLPGDGEGAKQPKKKDKHNSKFGTSFTLERVQNTRQAAQSLIDTLQEYYGGKEQSENMMFNSWLTPWNFETTNATDDNGMVEKLVDTMARALVTDDQTDFIIGTIGSSVAAGHDNCNYDSYELQMERTFGPVWEAAGMKLVCQNAGEGGGCGDDFSNQVFCIKQNVSPEIDIAHCECI